MANTTAEVITVDGVSLKTYARNVETLAATLRTPGKLGANVPVAHRAGAIWTPHKTHEQNEYVWPMWLVGSDDDGEIPSGSSERVEFFKRLDELTALFDKNHELLDVRHILPDLSIRQAKMECIETINFAINAVNPIARFSVSLLNPAAYWNDVNTFDVVSSVIGADWVVATGATAPLDDGTYIVTGPITNPRITDPFTNGYFQYNGALTAGQSMNLSGPLYTLTGGGGFAPTLANVVFSGTAGRLMRLVPNNVTREYKVRLSGTGTTVDTSLRVQGRRKYLLG